MRFGGQGLLEEAEAPFNRALELAEKLFGAESVDVATSLNNKALLLKKMVRVVDASCMLLWVLLSLHHEAVETNGGLLRICACC